jgi:hypothetical protein
MSPGQQAVSPKQRAHTVPLLSSTFCRRNLGQLMPSPGKASIVPPVHEVLRFSSLPRSLEPLADVMDVDNIAKLPEESQRVASPPRSRTPPSQKESDSSLSCKTPVGDKSLPSTSQLPSVAADPKVILCYVSPSVLPLSLDVRLYSVLAKIDTHICADTRGTPQITRGTRR